MANGSNRRCDVTERGARLGMPTLCDRAIFDVLSIYAGGGDAADSGAGSAVGSGACAGA